MAPFGCETATHWHRSDARPRAQGPKGPGTRAQGPRDKGPRAQGPGARAQGPRGKGPRAQGPGARAQGPKGPGPRRGGTATDKGRSTNCKNFPSDGITHTREPLRFPGLSTPPNLRTSAWLPYPCPATGFSQLGGRVRISNLENRNVWLQGPYFLTRKLS